MKNVIQNERSGERRRSLASYPLVIVALSIVAIVATFILANSSFEVSAKTRGFSAIIAAFLITCVAIHLWHSRRGPASRAVEEKSGTEMDRGLHALEEAGEFFAGSLKPADTFRLVASRVRDLLPFRSIVLFLLDPTRTRLQVAQAEGAGADGQKDKSIGFDEALAGQCFVGRCVQIDGYLALDETQDFGSSVAIPLFHGTEVYGVLQLLFLTLIRTWHT